MDPETLNQIREDIKLTEIDLHSFLVVRHGYIVFEYYADTYDQDTQHNLYSVTKSVTSTLVGIALDQGKLESVDQTALSFFEGRRFANPSPQKEALTLEHLLTMTSGLDWNEDDQLIAALESSPNWAQMVLDTPMAAEPGGAFNYCSGCSHILSAVVQQAAGMPVLDFAQRYLFGPLGITDFTWDVDPQAIAVGGWGLHMTTRDMAKIGLLYLHEGQWDGQQVVPAEWVQAATRAHVDLPDLDYGYQWWIYPARNAFVAQGRGGQTIFVAPEDDLVVTATAGLRSHALIYSLIEQFVFPAVTE
jgi:CubicO group peptidase (beta-lactamase class C family)